MIRTTITIEFITYDGQPGSRPPIYECGTVDTPEVPLPHELDGYHYEMLIISEGKDAPLSMAFMLFYLDQDQRFEWCSSFFAKELADKHGHDIALDDDGYISFPLKPGDRWAIWPTANAIELLITPTFGGKLQ